MKTYIKVFFLLFILIFLFSCNKDNKAPAEDITESQATERELRPAYVRNKNEIFEPEYSHSMLNRFQAEDLLPEEKKGQNKKTEDVTMLSVYSHSQIQMFIYGDGADDTSLCGDFIFFVQRGNISFIFDFGAVDEKDFIIHSIHAGDLDSDNIYEIYLNIETKEGRHIIVGINLKDKNLISAPFSGDSYMHFYEDRLFWIQVPKEDEGSPSCYRPVFERDKIFADPTISDRLFNAALSDWINKQNTNKENQ